MLHLDKVEVVRIAVSLEKGTNINASCLQGML